MLRLVEESLGVLRTNSILESEPNIYPFDMFKIGTSYGLNTKNQGETPKFNKYGTLLIFYKDLKN